MRVPAYIRDAMTPVFRARRSLSVCLAAGCFYEAAPSNGYALLLADCGAVWNLLVLGDLVVPLNAPARALVELVKD